MDHPDSFALSDIGKAVFEKQRDLDDILEEEKIRAGRIHPGLGRLPEHHAEGPRMLRIWHQRHDPIIPGPSARPRLKSPAGRLIRMKHHPIRGKEPAA